MAGLDEAGLEELLPAKPKPEAQPGALGFERADAIRREIYQRHGINPSRSLEEAIDRINMQAQLRNSVGNEGGQPSAWANPEERARAREAYARQGATPAEARKRWEESTHLLDPRTYQYMQNFGRDIDFLSSELESQKAASGRGMPGRMLDANAIRHYDGNSGERLSGAGGGVLDAFSVPSGGYQRFDGFVPAMIDNTSNPDVPLGNYMTVSEVVPQFLRLQGSGETETAGESWRRANAGRLTNNRYRMVSPHPILDLPTGSTGADIASRIGSLQREVAALQVPMADERWQRTVGWTPPGFLSDTLDSAISMADPTMVLPAIRGAGALTNATKAAIKGSRIAGSGWIAPAVRNAVGPAAEDFAWDQGFEQAAGHGLQAAMGGQLGRSSSQYWRGGGKPRVDFAYKTDEEVAEARQAGEDAHARLKDDDGVSRADSEPYNRMRADGTLTNPPKFYWGMSPSGPAY